MRDSPLRLAIFHYNPLELFPPVMNMINYLASSGKERIEIQVYTTHTSNRFSRFQCNEFGNVSIVRVGFNESNRGPMVRYIGYLWHYLFSLLSCVWLRPHKMFYIETMSSPVPLFLKRTLFKGTPLFIHYHEYMSPAEYMESSFLAKAHKNERFNYDKAEWVSHTNGDRMDLFLNDIKNGHSLPVHIMPNYPSDKWAHDFAKKNIARGKPIKIVYVGAVDLNNMFFPEFMDWVEEQKGDYTFDILSNQNPEVILEYMEARKTKFITVQPTSPYFELPKILCNYDVGVILYKGLSKNFLYNAPNKLFEYLACGLDVWYPSNLIGIQSYTRTDCHPLVVPFDFGNLRDAGVNEIMGRDIKYVPTAYYCESVYKVLLDKLMEGKS